MVASRFENSLFSRPWMGRTGVYPGQPAATEAPAVNAPLQVMAGAAPLMAQQQPQDPYRNAYGGGEGNAGGMGAFGGYGTSPDFGSWASNIIANIGPLGMARTGLTMIADPARTTPYGSFQDILGLLGWGGQQQPGAAFGGMSNADIADMPTQGFADATGVGVGTPNGLANALAETVGAVEAGGAGVGDYGGPTSASASPEGGFADATGWRYGGNTGAGADGRVQPNRPAGIVHEGEEVIRHEAARKYGREPFKAINEGKVPPNKLAMLAKRYR